MILETYTKQYPSNPELLPEIEEFVIEIARKAGIKEDQLDNLALAVAEASSNSILHGNKMDKNKKIKITFNIHDDKYEIIFKDEGTGFIVEDVPDPTIPENILKENGRGIHIMNTFLDDLKYNFTDDGTEAILIIAK
ncbi:MAG: ATP-binding protein [Melioribacteraceae bacterium]|nr:ATP-binding protein [Melioribacteraceae bacterium]